MRNQPTEDEIPMITKVIHLPTVLKIIERQINDFELSGNPLRKLFIASAQILHDQVSIDLKQSRKELTDRRIKMFSQNGNGDVANFKFSIRGYVVEYNILKPTFKQTAESLLKYHIDLLFPEAQLVLPIEVIRGEGTLH